MDAASFGCDGSTLYAVVNGRGPTQPAHLVTVNTGTGAITDIGLSIPKLDALVWDACDSTPPVLSLPGSFAVEATGPSGATATWSASASDPDDAAGPVSCSPASGSIFPIGQTSVSCTSTDTHGNTGSGSFTVTVRDTTPPAISGTPASITLEATGPNGAVATYSTPTASDLVDGSRSVSCAPASGFLAPLGTTTVSCTSSDTRGNQGTSSFTVTVRDTTPPDLRLPQRAIHAATTSKKGRVLSFVPVAKDLVDGLLAET